MSQVRVMAPDEMIMDQWMRERGFIQGNMYLRWERNEDKYEVPVVTDPDFSATKIQSVWRGVKGRETAEYLRYLHSGDERVYWGEDGIMVIMDTKRAAREIQRVARGFMARIAIDREKYIRARQPEDKVAHGCPGGGKKNPPGTFFCSKKKNNVLASGFIFQKGGDHRWAVGMKSEDYCPTHMKIEKSDCYMCLCQCPSTMVARARPYTESGKSSPIFTEELAMKLIFT